MLWRLLTGNLVYKFLALVLAVVLYLYVLSEQNPIIQRTWRVNPSLHNLSANLLPLEPSPLIEVKLEAPRQVITMLSPKQIKAYLDLKDKGKGRYTLPVHLLAPKEVKLISLTPRKVSIELDTIIEKSFPLECNKIGTLPRNYVLAESERIKPDTAVVRGFEDKVNQVKHLLVTVGITNLTEEIKREVSIRAIDEEAREVSGLTIKPDKAWVWLKASPLISSQVLITPQLVDSPPAGYKVAEVKTEPDKVLVKGPEDKVLSLSSIKTAPIDLSKLTSDLTQDIAILSPAPTISLERQTVRVTVKIEKEKEKEPPP